MHATHTIDRNQFRTLTSDLPEQLEDEETKISRWNGITRPRVRLPLPSDCKVPRPPWFPQCDGAPRACGVIRESRGQSPGPDACRGLARSLYCRGREAPRHRPAE